MKQVLQKDIESHSKIVSAVKNLCEHLLKISSPDAEDETQNNRLQSEADEVEKRFHAIWLQSLEWQFRLEEASHNGIVSVYLYLSSLSSLSPPLTLSCLSPISSISLSYLSLSYLSLLSLSLSPISLLGFDSVSLSIPLFLGFLTPSCFLSVYLTFNNISVFKWLLLISVLEWLLLISVISDFAIEFLVIKSLL